MSANSNLIGALPTVWHRPNFRRESTRLPHNFMRGMGPRMEEVVVRFCAALAARFPDQLKLAWAGESTNTPGICRPLRIIRMFKPGHSAACDVNLYSQGGDLYVRFESRPRTRITYLRWILYVLLFLTLVFTISALFIEASGQWALMVREFSEKHNDHFEGHVSVIYDYMMYGDPTLGGRPWGVLDFMRLDALLFLMTIGKIPMIVAAGVGGILMLMPNDWINYPCRLIGYPRQDEFRNIVNQHNSQIADAFSQLLADDFGIYQGNGVNPV